MDKVKVGVIGCGNMALQAHIPSIKANPDAELTAICDFRKKVTADLCRRWDIPFATDSIAELLEQDLDAVYILTPLPAHLANIKAALAAGKAVFTEKPVAMSAAGVRELAAIPGKGVSVGYMKQHETNIRKMREIQSQSDWGKLLFIRNHSFVGKQWNGALNQLVKPVTSDEKKALDLSNLDPAPAWLKGERDEKFYSYDNPYYSLLDTGCHSVNLLHHLAGVVPKVLGVNAGNGVTVVHFDFAGTPGELEFCVNFRMDRWDEVTELYFERASVRILTPPPLNRQASAVVEIYSESNGLHQNLVLEDTRRWAFQLETDSFIKKVKEGCCSSDLDEAAGDLEVIEQIYQTITGA